jgi:hypothetical protein
MIFINYILLITKTIIMDCSVLMKMYEETVGGTLVCNYDTKKMFIKHTSMKCNIKPKDYVDTVVLMMNCEIYSDISPDCKFERIKETNSKKINESDIKNINHYLNNNEIGFITTNLEDKYQN